MDAILALRLLAELHRNFNRQLDVAYIDIKSAFDSVDRLHQVEEDVGLSVGAAWIAGQDRSMWRTLRPSAGQAQQ